MNLEITSYEGAGPLRFGMTPAQVRAAAGVPCETFKRAPESAHPCDYFPSIAAFAYYTAGGEAEAFEFAEPAAPTYRGADLLALGLEAIVGKLRQEDPELTIDDDGFTSFRLGIGAYAPEAGSDPSLPPEGIIVFAKGYYD